MTTLRVSPEMKLPPGSMAQKKLNAMHPIQAKERVRCAKVALELALWCKETYSDEPAQWVRCEQIFKDILKDNQAQITWYEGK